MNGAGASRLWWRWEAWWVVGAGAGSQVQTRGLAGSNAGAQGGRPPAPRTSVPRLLAMKEAGCAGAGAGASASMKGSGRGVGSSPRARVVGSFSSCRLRRSPPAPLLAAGLHPSCSSSSAAPRPAASSSSGVGRREAASASGGASAAAGGSRLRDRPSCGARHSAGLVSDLEFGRGRVEVACRSQPRLGPAAPPGRRLGTASWRTCSRPQAVKRRIAAERTAELPRWLSLGGKATSATGLSTAEEERNAGEGAGTRGSCTRRRRRCSRHARRPAALGCTSANHTFLRSLRALPSEQQVGACRNHLGLADGRPPPVVEGCKAAAGGGHGRRHGGRLGAAHSSLSPQDKSAEPAPRKTEQRAGCMGTCRATRR